MTFQPPSTPLPTPLIHSSNPVPTPFQPATTPLPTAAFQPPISKDIGPALGSGPISDQQIQRRDDRQALAAKQIRLARLLAEVRALRADLANAGGDQ